MVKFSSSCPHNDGMFPVNAADILNLFQYIPERPLFYRLGHWPQLFARCCLCNETYTAPGHYKVLAWEEALAWAEGDADG